MPAAVRPEGAVLSERMEPKLGAGQQMAADGKNPFQRVCSQRSNGPEKEKPFRQQKILSAEGGDGRWSEGWRGRRNASNMFIPFGGNAGGRGRAAEFTGSVQAADGTWKCNLIQSKETESLFPLRVGGAEPPRCSANDAVLYRGRCSKAPQIVNTDKR